MDYNTKSRQDWLARLASGYRQVPRSSWRASIAAAIIGSTLLVLAVNYARADEINAGAAAHLAVLEMRDAIMATRMLCPVVPTVGGE